MVYRVLAQVSGHTAAYGQEKARDALAITGQKCNFQLDVLDLGRRNPKTSIEIIPFLDQARFVLDQLRRHMRLPPRLLGSNDL
jgi:hypothetical protein